jgi:exodeoxyribonuclease V alpha subunit
MGFLADKAGEAPRSPAQEAQAAAAPEVFQVTIQRLKFHNNDTGFFIAEAVAAGPIPRLPADIVELGVRLPSTILLRGISQSFQGTDQVGATLEVAGEWNLDPRYGLQFAVLFVQNAIPTTAEALEKYLASGQLKGIGPSTARAIVDKWGLDTIRILDHTPERLSEIQGLTEAKIKSIGDAWKNKRELYGIISFLGLHGIGETLALRVRDALGSEDLERKVRANPYLLTEIDGIGFKKADAVALSIGFPSNSPQRLAAALQHILRDNVQKNGHTAIPVSQWIDEAVAQLARPREEIREMCQRLVDSKQVVLRKLKIVTPEDGMSDQMCVSPMREARAERMVANHLKRLIEGHPGINIEQNAVIQRVISDPARKLDPSQKDAGWAVFQSPVSVLTGGPGTGKTTTLRSIVAAAKEMGMEVVLSAPTGRAAKRMEEAIGMESMTMHRRLKFAPGMGFQKNEADPMMGNLFVIDEASMVDISMMCAWLRAIPTGATVLFVGDADQLPSVGAGDVLRDLIHSGRIPVARLTRVHRQAEGSGIAWNASQVLAGRAPAMSGDPWRDDFAFVKADDGQAIRSQMVDLIEGMLRQGVPHADIQVLCPQRTLDCGTEALNEMLRGILNPNRPDAERLAQGLCVGERLMQVKNNYDLEVFNGDMGTVTKLGDDGSVTMQMEDGREVVFPKNGLKDLQFGYAITVHKSQGGERPVIIMPISKGHGFTLNRSLLYTAITRGKSRVILIGDGRTALIAAKKKSQLVRTTGLLNEMEMVKVPALSSKGRPHP